MAIYGTARQLVKDVSHCALKNNELRRSGHCVCVCVCRVAKCLFPRIPFTIGCHLLCASVVHVSVRFLLLFRCIRRRRRHTRGRAD